MRLILAEYVLVTFKNISETGLQHHTTKLPWVCFVCTVVTATQKEPRSHSSTSPQFAVVSLEPRRRARPSSMLGATLIQVPFCIVHRAGIKHQAEGPLSRLMSTRVKGTLTDEDIWAAILYLLTKRTLNIRLSSDMTTLSDKAGVRAVDKALDGSEDKEERGAL